MGAKVLVRKKTRVSILIINFNSKTYLNACLRSLRASQSVDDREIIVVDNASTDGSSRFVKKNFPDIRLIQNTLNLGFAKAVNIGAKAAKGEYLFILNPDTLVFPDTLGMLLALCQKKQAIVGPLVTYPTGALQYSCGYFPTLVKVLWDRVPIVRKITDTYLVRHDTFYKRKRKVDWVSGAAIVVPKGIWHRLKGFDERYFMYGEEVEFCWRAQKNQVPVWFTPTARVIHEYQGRDKRRRLVKARWMRRGLLLFFREHKSPAQFFVVKTLMIFETRIKLSHWQLRRILRLRIKETAKMIGHYQAIIKMLRIT